MFTVKWKQAISMVNYITSFVECFESYCLVRIALSINTNLVEFLYEFIDNFNIWSDWSSTVELSICVVKNHSTFSLKCQLLAFEMGQIYYMLVIILHLGNEQRITLISSWLIEHRMKNQDTIRDWLSLVACKPIWKDCVWSIIAMLFEHCDINVSISHILNELLMFCLNLISELLTVLVVISIHEFVIL